MVLPIEVLSILAVSICGVLFGALTFLVRHAFNSVLDELKGLREEVHALREVATNWKILESRGELLEAQIAKVLGE